MGFEPQLKEIVSDFDLPNKSLRQNFMFSATFDPEVREIANRFMKDYYYIHSTIENENNKNIEQSLIQVKEDDKLVKLHEQLQKIKNGSILSKKYLIKFSLHGNQKESR
jgi:superfamily II DNA/RNA helicase